MSLKQLNLRHLLHRRAETTVAHTHMRLWDSSDTEAVLDLYYQRQDENCFLSEKDLEDLATTTGHPLEAVYAFVGRWEAGDVDEYLEQSHQTHGSGHQDLIDVLDTDPLTEAPDSFRSLSEPLTPEPFVYTFETETLSTILSGPSSLPHSPLTEAERLVASESELPISEVDHTEMSTLSSASTELSSSSSPPTLSSMPSKRERWTRATTVKGPPASSLSPSEGKPGTGDKKSITPPNILRPEDDGKPLQTKKFVCETCGKVYNWAGDLKRHVQSHGQKVSCKLLKDGVPCTRKFSNTKDLVTHEKNDHDHHTCSFGSCRRTFSEKAVYEDHLNSHRAFPCQISNCTGRYATIETRRRHWLKHGYKIECGIPANKFIEIVKEKPVNVPSQAPTPVCIDEDEGSKSLTLSTVFISKQDVD